VLGHRIWMTASGGLFVCEGELGTMHLKHRDLSTPTVHSEQQGVILAQGE
jgi:hypothetical protein